MKSENAKALYIPDARLLDPVSGRDARGALFVDAAGRIAPVPAKLPPASKLTVIDRPGLVVGFVGGSMAAAGTSFATIAGTAEPVASGFLGALLAGGCGETNGPPRIGETGHLARGM